MKILSVIYKNPGKIFEDMDKKIEKGIAFESALFYNELKANEKPVYY